MFSFKICNIEVLWSLTVFYSLFDIFELLLASFESFGSLFERDGVSKVFFCLLGIRFGLFEVSNIFKLRLRVFKPRNYVI